MFLFNFISGLDNYPIPLVFRPQHTHNYKSLYDARQSLRQMSKQPIKNKTVKCMLYLGYGLLHYVLIYKTEVSFNFHLTFLQLDVTKMFTVQ